MVAQIGGLLWFMPIFSFLFVFLLVYALLKKVKILGDNELILLLTSFILASFFIVRSSLVDFVSLNVAWFAVFLVCIFMILILVGFVNKNWEEFFSKSYLAWIVIGLLVLLFILSSAQVFNWAINTSMLRDWVDTKWFGFVILLLVATGVSFVLAKKK